MPLQRVYQDDGTVQNVKIVMISSNPNQILYCENSKPASFLLKYFKYECNFCERFTSVVLYTDCCQVAICHDCAVKLQSCLA